MVVEWRRNRFQEQSELLIWKLAYYVCEGDGPLRKQFSKLDSDAKANVYANYTGFVRTYMALSAIDDEPSDSSESEFFVRIAKFFCGISFECEPLSYGTYSAGVGILTCCLKFEGWAPLRDEEVESMADFYASLHSVKATSSKRTEEVIEGIKRNWEFTGFSDGSGFKVVATFRDRMRRANRSLSSLFS